MTLQGIYPIVPTPFLEDGSLDLPSIGRLIAFMAEKKVHGLAIMGALGEGHKLTEQERAEVISAYRSQLPAGMQMVVGVRAPATDPAMVMARAARELGADAILLGPHGVQNDAALLAYYQRVSAAAGIPCIMHDYPAVTGITLSVELISRMVETAANINNIKLEDPPTVMKMQALSHAVYELVGGFAEHAEGEGA